LLRRPVSLSSCSELQAEAPPPELHVQGFVRDDPPERSFEIVQAFGGEQIARRDAILHDLAPQPRLGLARDELIGVLAAGIGRQERLYLGGGVDKVDA
jgi:hypothetical protein